MSVVTLFVESQTVRTERRFPRTTPISELHTRLEAIVGIQPSSQQLTITDPASSSPIPVTSTTLLTIPDYSVLHVTSTCSTSINFEDVSQVEKYEMQDTTYDAMSNTVRAFKRRHNMGRFADNASAMSIDNEDEFVEEAQNINVGQRCEVAWPGSELARRGCVRFVGKTQFRQGYWIGVEYDEPVGKNNGTVDGTVYFECAPLHGSFVRPDKVTVGDFPEDDFGSDLEEM
ncbi:hypothetical protein EV180_005589 [Coemansia sp. RSA 518]|nr:hypothetical protein LPJ69_000637 [Coemansia sp. RSA 1752]KAJ1794744.1 hypothetical protein LPJ67_000517 [Coemansia sp. RSA 1938]KAJ2174513.1 hypothetical protein GGH16_001266 [Coemansia sp. RSA 560]KAJ2187466.1 hypothetical protein EV181_002746 [Coemansia sp. RSA 532]KAJ2210003.1 hypothetical protein IW143_004315 [Coemansia sp. RSA 520]KAJ2218819.1 hypothetical protein EV180_005589 [Coemansia sp. RSA 518]KAJ2433419.1 hypothetical protein IWW41_002071 [Coemansia sp. RSA 2522]KAJ2837267.1 